MAKTVDELIKKYTDISSKMTGVEIKPKQTTSTKSTTKTTTTSNKGKQNKSASPVDDLINKYKKTSATILKQNSLSGNAPFRTNTTKKYSEINIPKNTSSYSMTKAEYDMRRSSNPSMPEYGSYSYYKKREEELRPIMEKIANDFDRQNPTYKAWVENYEAGRMPADVNEHTREQVINLSKKFKYQNDIIAEYKEINAQLDKFDTKGIHIDEFGKIDTKSGAEEAKSAKERYRNILGAEALTTLEMAQGYSGQLPEEKQKGYEQREKLAHLAQIEADKEGAYNYYEKNKDKTYEDTIGGRFLGNYKVGRIGIKSNQAGYTSYNATSDDIEASEVYQALSDRIQTRNKETFKNNGATDEIIAVIGQYAPQGVDQAVIGTVGKVVGGLVGSKSAGRAIATATYMYEQTAGAKYVQLLQESDLSVEDAKKLASDEALSSAIVEFGLDFATSKLWSKVGSTSVVNNATSTVSNKLIKALSSIGISEKGAKTILNVAKNTGKLILNSMGEGSEEWWQEGISITADRYAAEGEKSSPFKLLLHSLWLPQYSSEDFSRMGEAFLGGAIIGFGQGGVDALTSYGINKTASKFADTRETNNTQRVVADAIINDEESLNALIEEGKANGTASAKIAEEVEQAKENGTLTKSQVKKLISANEKAIKSEQTTTETDPLEQTAREVVEERNRIDGLALLEARRNGNVTPQMLERLSQVNAEITNEEAKKATGFGDKGAELVAKAVNTDGATFYQTVAEVKPSYLAGFNNPDMDIKDASYAFKDPIHQEAFSRGQQDAVMQNSVAKEKAKSATVYDGAFTENEYTKKWSEATKKMVSTVAKHFGMDISVVDKIIASRTVENGVVTEHEANASHNDGKMEISNNKTAEKLIHALVMHESGHRMEQFATDEWNELCSFLYERAERLGRRIELGVSQGMLFDDVKAEHDEAGISLSTKGYIGEIAVRELETIFSSPEEFNSFISEIESNPQAKSAWGKFVQWLSELIEDLKRAWSQRKMTAEEKASLKELERIKELYAKAYLATKDAVAERAKEQSADTKSSKNLEIKINEEYNGSANYSIKSKYNEYNTIGMQWAYSSSTQIGDKKVLYNPYKKKYVLAEATKDDLGFIELKSGTYKQMREDEKFYESNKQGEFSDDERAIDKAIHNFEVRQNDNTWDNVDVGNKGAGIQNAEVSKGKSKSNRTTDTRTTDGDLTKKNYSLKTKAPTFYSQMGKTIDGIKQDKIGANSVVSYLTGRGVKAEEIKWSGIETFLEGKKSVTKAELQEFVAGSMLDIGVKTIEDDIAISYTQDELEELDRDGKLLDKAWAEANDIWNEAYGTDIPADIMGNDDAPSAMIRYVIDQHGGIRNFEGISHLSDAERKIYDDYSENSITRKIKDLEEHQAYIAERAKARRDNTKQTKYHKYTLDGGSGNYRELLFKMPNSEYTNDAMSYHWGEGGILAHARVQDFDVNGQKMLFIEEIQSDWHNEGQKKGYASEIKELREQFESQQKKNKAERKILIEQLAKHYENKVDFPESEAERTLMFATNDSYMNSMIEKYAIPTELAERAKAYDVSQKETAKLFQKSLKKGVEDAPFRNNYHEYVLKNLLRMAAEDGYDSIGWTTADIQSDRWSDKYAEGYRIEYDQDIPKFLNKYGKKWGAKVGREWLTINEDLDEVNVWSMPITDSMKESVLYEGQPMFSLKAKDQEYLELAKDPEKNEARLREMVEEAARNSMPNSKITTKDGKLRIVFHGTNTGEFTVFNPDYIGMSSGDDGFFGMGFYFAYSEGEASYYGAKRIIPAYLDLKNPFNFDKELQTYKGKKAASGYAPDAVAYMNFADKFPDIAKNITVNVVEKGSDTYKELSLADFSKAFKDVIDNKKFEYQEQANEFGEKETLVLADPQIHEYEYDGKKHKYKDYGFQKRFWGKPNDLDVAYEYLANSVYSHIDMYNKTRLILDNNREFTNALKNMGYDGTIQSEFGDEAVAFSSEQIKSAEPVTYDDNGKVIPLSERFNTKNDDIRYSLKDSEGKSLTKEQAEYFKDSKVRDENGNLLVVYHGSPAKFTVFNHNKINAHGNSHGRGFYFTSRKSFAEGYKQEGGQLLKGYLNITNPLSEDKVTIKKAGLLKLIKATCKEQAQEYVRDEGYDSLSDALRDTWISNYVDTYGTSIENAYREVADIIYRGNTNDVEMVAELTNAGAGTENTLRLAHDILGYDGVIYENEEGHNEFVSLVSNQFKDVNNTNPTSNPDINFSLKGTNNTNLKERKELLDIIEHLKGEFEITKFAKADPKKLAKMTRDILKEYDSKADYDETYNAIDELYQYMANGEGGNVAWEEVYNRAYNIARTIAQNALVVDDTMYQEYRHLREYLRITPMKFTAYDSVPSGYENFNDFRRHNMGRLNFTKDGMGIDAVYQELAHLYPEFFDAEEQINSADQLERIIDVLDELQPMEINPFDSQIEQASMQLANDLTSRFFDVPQAKPTFADKAERRVVEAHIKGGKKVEAVRQQKDAKIKKLIESQREKTKKQLDKLREQRDTKIEKEKAKRRDAISKMSENQKAKVLRARITRHASELSKKLVSGTDNQHIPFELRGAVATLLEHINLESNYTYDAESHSYKKNDEGLPTKRTQAFNELKKVYADIASSVVVDPDLLGEYGLLSDVISLADKRIADMTSNELEKVWQTIRAIEASISTANKVFSEGKFATIFEVADTLRAYNEGKTSKAEFKGIIGKGKKLATLDMLTPETYLHYLGSAGDSIFRMMRDAQDKHISIMKEVADFTHKELKDVNVNKLENTIHTVKLGGEDVKLSTAQIMELYVLMKREQAKEHILIGGILPDVTKGKGLKQNTRANPTRNISIGEIAEAISVLTDEQMKIADKLQRYVSSVLSKYGNEASMQVYNYEKFAEENYWTIRTNKQEIQSDIDKDTAVTSVANKGMTKATKPHANTSVRIGSIFDTFASHSSDMATYAAWLGTSEDVNRIRNFVFWENGARTGTVKGILDTVHGVHGSQYLEKLLTDIAIGVKGTDNLNPFEKLVGHYKAASVGANIRVIIQQPTAMIRALDMINPIYLTEGAFRPLNGWKKAKKYAPIAQWKDWGHFDINTGRQMKDVLFDNASLLEKTKQVGMWGASMADSLAWGQLWNAVEAETKAKHKELEVGSDAYYETVAKRFTEIVDHTQVVDGILQRSQIMRSPDALTKMATSFMGEPTKQYNMAVAALHDVISNNGDARKKAVKRLGRTAMALAVSGIINACAQSIIDALRDDDKEKDYWEKWLTAFKGDGEDTKLINSNIGDTVNPLNYVPFAKDIMSIMQGYDVKRMDTETITKTINAITNMHKAVTGTGKHTIAEASAQLFAEIARMYGVPVANVKRDVKSAAMSVAIETDNYLMQYRMEKAMLNINYAGNSKNFMDILFNAYNNDREAYEFIYNDMLDSGYDAEKIKSGMETRMKKAEGVTEASELSKRYMTPDDEDKYDSSLNRMKSSQAWKSATSTQKKNAEADLYKFLTSTSDDVVKAREEARQYGVDETEYALWQLAIEMADQPKGAEGSGSYSAKEKAEAINLLDFDDEEIAYFFGKGLNDDAKEELNETLNAGIDMQEYVNFKAAVNDMKADKNAKGKSIPNSKKKKVVRYLNSAGLTDEEWDYFYYEIMNYKK